MVMKLQTNKIILCVFVNVILLLILYNIPVKDNKLLENLCIFKLLTGKECWNCGMTRAFLSMLHFNIKDSIYYNSKSIIVFPITIVIYIYSWYKFIHKKNQYGL